MRACFLLQFCCYWGAICDFDLHNFRVSRCEYINEALTGPGMISSLRMSLKSGRLSLTQFAD